MLSRRLLLVVAAAVLGMAPGPSVPGGYSLNSAEKQAILETLNQSRAQAGWDASLSPLEWDASLEAIAQRWAATCTEDPSGSGLLAHNPDRGAGYQGSVGENISGWAVPPSPDPSVNLENAKTLVNLWVEEGQHYDYATNTCGGQPYSLRGDWKACGHYTQVVSRVTTKVGCGRSYCPNLPHQSEIVCDFAIAGNSYDPRTGLLQRP